jgi:rubredoxin
MLVHVCALCGYEYNPKDGDPDNGIAEETFFEELPADWVCPLCGAAKEDFEAELRENDEADEDY